MSDPLSDVVSLLRPTAAHSKVVTAAGHWSVRRNEAGQPFYCVVLDGGCRLEVDGLQPIVLERQDFVLIPAAHGFTVSDSLSAEAAGNDPSTTSMVDGVVRHGRPGHRPDVRLLVGYCAFGSPDATLLVSLLPQVVHVRGDSTLTTLVQLVVDESRQARPARDVILARLLEVLLLEALRSSAEIGASPGLVRGLADARLASAIRCMHESPTRGWTVAELARKAALSRSAFFERFSRAVGVTPMDYLLGWRMALAKELLRRDEAGLAEVAERVGYGSASTFSVAFARHVGMPPARFAKQSRQGPFDRPAV